MAPAEGGEADRPVRSAKVQLVDLHSSRVIETTRALDDGSYQFSTIEPGVYDLRVIPPTKDKKTEPASGDVAIELDPVAHESTIPEMKVLQSECEGVQLLR
jgi:hypothetical protein